MADTILGKASEYALKAHGDQLYGRKPYHYHLLNAVYTLCRFFDWDELPQSYIDATWLHDTIEDTKVTFDELTAEFGLDTATLVSAVTNPVKDFASGDARKLLLYSKIRNVTGAINIKLADRVSNVENCISLGRVGRKPGRLFKKYLTEWPEFEASLRGRCAGEGPSAALMWDHLSELMELGRKQMEESK